MYSSLSHSTKDQQQQKQSDASKRRKKLLCRKKKGSQGGGRASERFAESLSRASDTRARALSARRFAQKAEKSLPLTKDTKRLESLYSIYIRRHTHTHTERSTHVRYISICKKRRNKRRSCRVCVLYIYILTQCRCACRWISFARPVARLSVQCPGRICRYISRGPRAAATLFARSLDPICRRAAGYPASRCTLRTAKENTSLKACRHYYIPQLSYIVCILLSYSRTVYCYIYTHRHDERVYSFVPRLFSRILSREREREALVRARGKTLKSSTSRRERLLYTTALLIR